MGFVPKITKAVTWTTPTILSGYIATGSIRGSIMQIINIIIGIFVYMPFIKKYDKNSTFIQTPFLNQLIETLKESEKSTVPVVLTEIKSPVGALAKTLVNDLQKTIEENNIELNYQPQYNDKGICIGAEGLLRWKHPLYGIMYPPLAIKLAGESGLLWELEKSILKAMF